jgi:hypothetical protein
MNIRSGQNRFNEMSELVGALPDPSMPIEMSRRTSAPQVPFKRAPLLVCTKDESRLYVT